MPWHLRAILNADLFFINRVFMPFAHWVDWRFHRSPYQQAYVVLHVAMGFNVLGAIWTAGHIPWFIAIVTLLAAGLMTFVSRFWFKRLVECQRQYEKDPTTLCYAQVFFMAPYAAFPRMFYLHFGSLLVVVNAWDLAFHMDGRRALDLVFSSWLMLCGVGLYLAGAFPPQRPRRKKQAAGETIPANAALSPG
jgi:hypothetical protein